jgi:hypothetical protein
MSTKSQSVAVRLLPSLTDVAFIMPLIFQFNQLGGAPALLADSDTCWHLRTGEWIIAHGQVPRQDIFSYTHAGQPWYAWEWLWDVCFGFLNQHFGLAAVIACSMLVICCTSALLYRLVLRKCPNPLIAIVVTGFAAAGASIHWLARPHLFTLLLTVIFLGILDRAYIELLDRAREGVASGAGGGKGFSWASGPATRKMLWLLPVLTILWTNLHGGFLAGLIVIGGYAGGGLIGMLLAPSEARQAILARVKPFVVCGILCTLATLVNPYFIGLHKHIVTYLMDPYFYEHITEFMSYNFAHPAARFVETLMLLSVATAVWNLYRRRFEYVVLLCGWLHLGLHARRNIALFSVVCAPLVAEAVFYWLRDLESAHVAQWIKSLVLRFEESSAQILETDRLPRLHLASAVAMVILAVLLYAPQPPETFQATYDAKEYPVEAVKVLMRDGDDRIFTNDLWGGYLIYRLYPKVKVFIDGRSDFYSAAFELKYLDVLDVKYDWDQNLDHFGAHTALVPADCPLAGALKENPRWRVVYDDKKALIFRLVKPGRTSQQVSNCPNQGLGENCGRPAAGAASMGDRTPRESGHPRNNIVAEIGPPRLPLLNRP